MLNKDRAPEHLQEYVSTIDPQAVGYFVENIDWFNSLMWKGQLTNHKETRFKIEFSGIKYDDDFIATEDNIPLIVWAIPVNEQGKKILLFDEREHGYNAIMIERKELSEDFEIKTFISNNGSAEFEIYLWTNSSIDFEDEYNLNEEGEIQTLDGSHRTLDHLTRNAFDYLGILVKDVSGVETKIIDIELA